MQFLKKLQNNNQNHSNLIELENELGESPKNWGGMRHWYSEGFYELFKSYTLIETFPNYNQIYSKWYEIKYNSKFELKKKKGGLSRFYD